MDIHVNNNRNIRFLTLPKWNEKGIQVATKDLTDIFNSFTMKVDAKAQLLKK